MPIYSIASDIEYTGENRVIPHIVPYIRGLLYYTQRRDFSKRLSHLSPKTRLRLTPIGRSKVFSPVRVVIISVCGEGGELSSSEKVEFFEDSDFKLYRGRCP